MIIENYEQELNAILAAYKRIPELGPDLLGLGEVQVDQINRWATELQQERFCLCIAGQMNSGKSTLLNALLFGMPVLPVDDQVMTSAITVIEHVSRHPRGMRGARITFYSLEEFKQIEEGLASNVDARQRLDAAVEEARNREVIKMEELGREPVELEGYERLAEFIAPVEGGKLGRYTPFVKEVTLFGDHPLLERLLIVDTPGINDPNRVREELTEQRIRDAHAVIYVSYAGQPFSKVDVEFINRYMIHVAPSHQIAAVNKIDTLESEAQLRQWVESLRNHRSEGVRQMASGDSALVYVSALGALLSQQTQGLSENELWYRYELGNKGYLEPEKHGLNGLRQAINERLLNNRGAALLLAHHRNIEGVFQAVEQSLLGKEREKKAVLAALLDESSSLRDKMKELHESSTAKISDLRSELEKGAADAIDAELNDLRQKDPRERAIQELRRLLGTVRKISELDENGPFHARKVVIGYNKAVERLVRESKRLLKVEIENLFREFQGEAEKIGFEGALSIDDILAIARDDLEGDMEGSIDAEVESKAKESIDGAVGIFDRYIASLFTDKPLEEMKIALLSLMEKMLAEKSNALYGVDAVVRRHLQDVMSPALRSVEEGVARRVNAIRKELDAIGGEKLAIDYKLESIRKDLDSTQGHLEQLRVLYAEIGRVAA